MEGLAGKRVAIFGLGRSGLSVGKAALRLGAQPYVVDQKRRDAIVNRKALDEAEAIGLPIEFGWSGIFDPTKTDFIVTNPAVDRRHAALKRAEVDGLEIISEVEFAYRISRAPIVALTGTNGKSTTTVMTYLCLQAAGEAPILCGNIYGSGYEERAMTDAALEATEDQVLVAEISSFQLEWIKEFRPVSAGVTNIWPDHLDRYESFKEYAATKQRIFENQREEDFAVVKANDPQVQPPKGPQVLTFGAHGEHAEVMEDAMRVLDKRIGYAELPFKEPHNYTNAAMACLLTYGFLKWKSVKNPSSHSYTVVQEAEEELREREAKRGSVYTRRAYPPSERAFPAVIFQGLQAFHGLAHRMEYVGERGGVRVINNSMCTNPDAVIKSAQSLRERKHILIGGLNKDLDFSPVKHYLSNRQNAAYLYGRAAEELNRQLGGIWPTFSTMQDAFFAATDAAKKGETIILAPGCASTDQFEDFRDRGNVFKKIALEWIHG